MIVVSHDQRLLDIASRVAWIEDGRLTERGGTKGPGGRRRSEREINPQSFDEPLSGADHGNMGMPPTGYGESRQIERMNEWRERGTARPRRWAGSWQPASRDSVRTSQLPLRRSPPGGAANDRERDASLVQPDRLIDAQRPARDIHQSGLPGHAHADVFARGLYAHPHASPQSTHLRVERRRASLHDRHRRTGDRTLKSVADTARRSASSTVAAGLPTIYRGSVATDFPQILADVDWGHMDGGWAVVMMLGMVLFWVIVIALVVWLARGGAQGFGRQTVERVTPLEILDRRFAEGEITSEEYRERREALRDSAC